MEGLFGAGDAGNSENLLLCRGRAHVCMLCIHACGGRPVIVGVSFHFPTLTYATTIGSMCVHMHVTWSAASDEHELRVVSAQAHMVL